MYKPTVSILLFLALNGGILAQTAPADSVRQAHTTLRDAQGNVVGQATLRDDGALKLRIELRDFKSAQSGLHGVHFHAVGKCDPTFAAAGGHFNPTGHKHGFLSHTGRHGGDLPNLELDAAGHGVYEVTTDLVTLGTGGHSLLDEDGTAIVIHAGPDDYRSDPAGNSGDRVACGVIQLESRTAVVPVLEGV